ncbi:MAG: response regulator, partial [Cytophagaceae bacterium]|nr:response regulator [Gemmatimonadaceae bacterium]
MHVLRQCGNGREAVKAIRELAPDLVFLDVQMPGVDGFGVVEAIGPLAMPAVIFVTAYDANAVKAFDAEAVDFLLKPIDDDRFARALARARRRLEERTQQAMGARVAAVLAQLG